MSGDTFVFADAQIFPFANLVNKNKNDAARRLARGSFSYGDVQTQAASREVYQARRSEQCFSRLWRAVPQS